MAADVSSLVRMLREHLEEQVKSDSGDGNSEALITRDLLGCLSEDLDLDLKAGNLFLQKLKSPKAPSVATSSSFDPKKESSKLHDLNFPPSSSSSAAPLNFFDGGNLDLTLFPSIHYENQSVCTLDKVKSALDRAVKGKRPLSSFSPSSSSSVPWWFSSSSESQSKAQSQQLSSSSSSIKKDEEQGLQVEGEGEEKTTSFAAACPCCLMYVLTWKSNPRCPRCRSIVPTPATRKKPRIDLNASL